MASTSRKPTNAAEAALRDYGLSLPQATEEFPWDHRALKVARKVFVFMGTDLDASAPRGTFSISCKLPESAPMALMLPGVAPTGYGLGKAGWVSAKFPVSKVPVAMLKEWILESYRAIAPKKLGALTTEVSSARGKPAVKRAPKKATAKRAAATKKASSTKRPARSKR